MRRGIYFSIASLLLMVLLLAMFKMTSDYRIQESEIEVTRTKVKVLNSIMEDMENTYFDRIAYMTAKNTLMGLSRYYGTQKFTKGTSGIIKKQLFAAMQDVNYNGTLYDKVFNHDLNNIPPGLGYLYNQYTTLGLVDELKQRFDQVGIDVRKLNITITDIKQPTPWLFVVDVDITYYFTDKAGKISWKGISKKTAEVSLIGLTTFDYNSTDGRRIVGVINSSWRPDSYQAAYGTKMGENLASPLPQGLCYYICGG